MPLDQLFSMIQWCSNEVSKTSVNDFRLMLPKISSPMINYFWDKFSVSLFYLTLIIGKLEPDGWSEMAKDSLVILSPDIKLKNSIVFFVPTYFEEPKVVVDLSTAVPPLCNFWNCILLVSVLNNFVVEN